MDTSKFPGRNTRSLVLRPYLQALQKLGQLTDLPTEEALLQRVDACTVCANCLWLVWGAVQFASSALKFDFEAYTYRRLRMQLFLEETLLCNCGERQC